MLWRDDQPEPPQQPQPAKNPADQFGLRQGTPDRRRATRPSNRRISPLNIQSTNTGTPTTTAHARTSESVGRIGPTIGHGAGRSHRQTCASPKLRAVAFALGCSESVAERRLYGAEAVNLQSAIILAVLLRRGEIEDAASFEAPISAAMLGPVVEPLLELQRSADESDGYEDVAQAAFVAEQSDEALALYVRRLASDLYHGTRLLAALKAEQKRRIDG